MLIRLVDRNLFPGPLFGTYKLPGEWSDLDGVFGGVFQTIRRVDVDLGRRDILMPECVTHLFYGSTVLKGHGGKGMPQRVRRDARRVHADSQELLLSLIHISEPTRLGM